MCLTSIDELKNAATAINNAANCLANQFVGTSELAEKAESPASPAKLALTLEDVRAILSNKSRVKYKVEIRELLKKYGATKLSLVYSKHYDALFRET